MDVLSWIGAISGLLSATAAAVGIWIAVGTSRKQVQLQKDIQSQQKQMAKEALRLTMDVEMLGWANRVLACLREAGQFMEASRDLASIDKARKAEVCGKLSEVIDAGRWHMPNHTDPENPSFGNEKGAAFAGYRTRALDVLVYFYDRFSAFGETGRLSVDQLIDRLNDSRREFVSEVFLRVEPKRFLELVGKPLAPLPWMTGAKEAQS